MYCVQYKNDTEHIGISMLSLFSQQSYKERKKNLLRLLIVFWQNYKNIQERTRKKQEVMQFDRRWRGEIASELALEMLNSYF